MRKTLSALVLVLALCSNAFAGDIPSPPAPDGTITNPPVASPTPGTEGSDETEASTLTADAAGGDTADGFAAAALSVINSVLALL